MKIIAISLAGLVVLCGSCTEQAYYLSSFNANTNPYHALPLVSDSVKSATYLDALFTAGLANQEFTDNILAVRAGLHRAHTLGNVHLFYGANASIGEYYVSSIVTNTTIYGNPYHPQYSGSKTFGGYGFNGGFNAAIPLRNGGEWRVFGLEGSIQNEFGEYFEFRKNIPDSLGNLISRNRWTGTIGITTEIISRHRGNSSFGYKFSLGANLNSYRNSYSYYNVRPIYVSNTIHFTKNNVTAFWQLNFGTYAGNFQFGINYKLGR